MNTTANNQNNTQNDNEGYVTPEQVTNYYEELDKVFGKITIVSESPSIGDLVRELEANKKD